MLSLLSLRPGPFAVLIGLAVSGCASMMPGSPERAAMLRANALSPDDPLEAQNRAVLGFNQAVNKVAIGPAAAVYKFAVPAPVRAGIANGVDNLEEPRIFANNVLQLRFGAAGTTLGRFAVNSTLGAGGLFDVATLGGLPKQSGDFGQTLYAWGVPSGPFLILPVLGPSTVRDGFGTVVDRVADPSSYVIQRYAGPYPVYGIAAVAVLGRINLLDDVEASSVDFYGRLRSTYLQKRASELGDAFGLTVTPATGPQPAR